MISNFGLPHQGWLGATVPLGISMRPPSKVFNSARFTHRLAAWRTRLSCQGEPSTKENCQGHTWGWALVYNTNPFCLICGTASGAGASIQSTWPESRAAVRALASGIGTSTTRSIFGLRFGSQ